MFIKFRNKIKIYESIKDKDKQLQIKFPMEEMMEKEIEFLVYLTQKNSKTISKEIKNIKSF